MSISVNGNNGQVISALNYDLGFRPDLKNEETETKGMEPGEPVEVTISEEGKEQYQKNAADLQSGQNSIEKTAKTMAVFRKGTVLMDSGLEAALYKEAGSLDDAVASSGQALSYQTRAENLLNSYAKLYDEISRGYDEGTKAYYVSDNKANLRMLSKEEALAELDRSYGKITGDMEALEKNYRMGNGDSFMRYLDKIADLKESRGREATKERDFIKEIESRRADMAADVEAEGSSRKMIDASRLFAKQYALRAPGTFNIADILKDINIWGK